MAVLSMFSATNVENIEFVINASVNKSTSKSTSDWIIIIEKWGKAQELDQKLSFRIAKLERLAKL